MIDLIFFKTNRDETLKNYIRSTVFKMDIISVLPFDLFYIWTGPFAAWRFVRVFKVL